MGKDGGSSGVRFSEFGYREEIMDVLLTFTGFHDPYFKGLVDQEEQPGPILSLLATRSFDHIFLFDTPSTQRVTGETRDAIKKIHHGSEVHVLEINLAAGRYRPQIAEKAPDDDPAQLIRETLAIEREIAEGLEKLLKEIEQ